MYILLPTVDDDVHSTGASYGSMKPEEDFYYL